MKKNILMLFGIGDVFCSTSSHRSIRRGPDIANKLIRLLSNPKYNFYGVVRVNEPSDTFESVSLKGFSEARTVDVKLCSSSVFDVNNQISIPSTDGAAVLDGNQLDFILDPEKYNLYIGGIDINGVFIDLINKVEQLGYTATVFSDSIKPFSKDTISHIKNSKVRFGKS